MPQHRGLFAYKKDKKAKVVASVWGANFFLSIPCRTSCFASVDLEKVDEFDLFFQIDPRQNS